MPDPSSDPRDLPSTGRGTRRERRIDELGPFDQALAAFETHAHLELRAPRADHARRPGEVVESGLPGAD